MTKLNRSHHHLASHCHTSNLITKRTVQLQALPADYYDGDG